MNIKLKTFKNVNNPKSIHGIYPYRGKISAIEAREVIAQFDKNKFLLDPFCGSGTILYEGAMNGLNSIGVELNPIGQVLSEGKINIHKSLNEEIEEIKLIIKKAKQSSNFMKMPDKPQKYFHEKTALEIMSLIQFFFDFSHYAKACFYGSICLAARGCNHYQWTSSTVGKDINPKRYINFYDKFLAKISKHYYPLPQNNSSKLIKSDTRNLSKVLNSETIDYVFTSPPYFDCLDYTAYYGKIIMEIFEIDRQKIRSQLIQNFNDYEPSMKIVLNQLYEVVKTGGKVMFVVGDKKIKGNIISGSEFFNDITPFKIIKVLERKYTNSSSQIFDSLNKTKRKEQIVLWEK